MKKAIIILVILFLLFSISANKDYVILGMLSFLLMVVDAVYVVYRLIKGLLERRNKKRVTIEETPDKDSLIIRSGDDTYYTKIAGVQYRNGVQDIGGFLGYIHSEPDNPYDKNAIAIYRNDDKLLGYIPKDETKIYREWSNKENLPCIGFIKAGDETPLFGKVKVIDSDKDETELIIAKYVRWLISTFGIKFIPANFSVDASNKLQTKKDWIAFLDCYINKKESELYEEI